jgi:uncharacterized protein YecE (DUF72 family)
MRFDALQNLPLYIGTMGFSYRDWNQVFYPNEMKINQYLSYYSRIFNSVEIDSTFYGTPRKSTVSGWLKNSPPGFKFSVKAPKLITHESGLINAWGLMTEFLDTMRLLEDRLGVILLQFPPSFSADQLETLISFIGKLPSDLSFAVEIRNQSWYTAEQSFVEQLGRLGIAWAATQYPNLPARIHDTAQFIYIRWIGQHGTFHKHDHERIDRTEDIQLWLHQIQENSENKRAVFGYFNNDYAGFAAGTAIKFYNLVGMPMGNPNEPKQSRLF